LKVESRAADDWASGGLSSEAARVIGISQTIEELTRFLSGLRSSPDRTAPCEGTYNLS